jgi:hemoglobin/transferrin/lactoferrin receptor protein
MKLSQIIFAIFITLSLASSARADTREKKLLGDACYDLLHSKEQIDEIARESCLNKLKNLPTLVVTPTRRPEDIRQVPAATTVVTEEQLTKHGVDGLAEALRDVPGVEVVDAGQPGQKRIRVRGEDSRRVAILVDGQEFFDPRDVGTPLLLAPEMVERIEVVRGTGSVLHGARAIGGVVNFITKKGGYHPLQGSISTTLDSATEGIQQYASLYGGKDGYSYRLSGLVADHDNRQTPAGEIDNTSFKNDSWSAYLAKEVDNHRVAVSFEDFHSSSEVYVAPEVAHTPPFLDFRIDVPERDRTKTAVFYDGEDLSETVKLLHVDAYYQKSEREFNTFSDTSVTVADTPIVSSTSILTSSLNNTVGANAQLTLQPNDSHSVIVGLEFANDELDQQRTRNVTRSSIPGATELTFESANQFSIEPFVQDEWTVMPDWVFTAGARGYFIDSSLEHTTRPGQLADSVSDEHLVGAAGLKYVGLEDTTFWGSWSQGYVFPSLNNLATGAFAGPDYVNPNMDLDPETANTFELGSRVENKSFAGEVAVFYTEAKDYINHSLCSAVSTSCIMPTGARDRVYVNIDEARTFGVELAGRLRGDIVTPYFSATWLRRRFDDSARGKTYDTGIPDVFGRLGVEFFKEVSGDADFWVDAYLRGASEADERNSRGVIEHTPGWVTTNVAFVSALGEKKQYQLSLELLNLGDKSYYTATESVLSPERSAVLKFAANF